ncbi:MAG TPA: hypothetical protein PKI41_01300 [Candidatus Competibacteraceae bacterium]|nr:hypothetical protein [Candidatus Competibacteraceae bacterium]HQA24872.1 hypothetical protein [Candidatus Competibacteraceae bacterium]HQD55730.1 hypothetical protein [Candidatus Competibacteraceae bacterium]
MNGVQLLGLIVTTALASSLATLALGWLLFERWLRPQLERRWAALAELLEARVKAGAGAAGQELLEPLRAQVRGGVEDAAAGLLPQFKAELTAGFREAATDSLPALRDEVRKGFIDALSASELLDRTAKKVVRTGSSLVESGLNLLRATRPSERDE